MPTPLQQQMNAPKGTPYGGREGINGGNPMLRFAAPPRPAQNPNTGQPMAQGIPAPHMYNTMQPTGPMNAAGVFPTNRYTADGRQVAMTPTMLAAFNRRDPASQSTALAGRVSSGYQPPRPGESYFGERDNQAAYAANQQIMQADNDRQGMRYNSDPQFRQSVDQYRSTMMQGIPNTPEAMQYYVGQTPYDQRNRPGAQPQAAAPSTYRPPTGPNAASAIPTGNPATMGRMDRDAYFRDLMQRGTQENNRYHQSGGTAATPLMDWMLQGDPWGNNVQQITQYLAQNAPAFAQYRR